MINYYELICQFRFHNIPKYLQANSATLSTSRANRSTLPRDSGSNTQTDRPTESQTKIERTQQHTEVKKTHLNAFSKSGL